MHQTLSFPYTLSGTRLLFVWAAASLPTQHCHSNQTKSKSTETMYSNSEHATTFDLVRSRVTTKIRKTDCKFFVMGILGLRFEGLK
jgi:hypothetical protein